MHMICRHPVNAAAVQSYCGQTIVAMTIHGDIISGVLDSCADGQIVLKPAGAAAATVQNLRKEIERSIPKSKRTGRRKGKTVMLSKNATKADVSFYGYGYGNDYGYGWGAALAIPLFLLAALFAAPFFFI